MCVRTLHRVLAEKFLSCGLRGPFSPNNSVETPSLCRPRYLWGWVSGGAHSSLIFGRCSISSVAIHAAAARVSVPRGFKVVPYMHILYSDAGWNAAYILFKWIHSKGTRGSQSKKFMSSVALCAVCDTNTHTRSFLSGSKNVRCDPSSRILSCVRQGARTFFALPEKCWETSISHVGHTEENLFKPKIYNAYFAWQNSSQSAQWIPFFVN